MNDSTIAEYIRIQKSLQKKFKPPEGLSSDPIIGLANTGDACYFNATLQLLLTCQPLIDAARISTSRPSSSSASPSTTSADYRISKPQSINDPINEAQQLLNLSPAFSNLSILESKPLTFENNSLSSPPHLLQPEAAYRFSSPETHLDLPFVTLPSSSHFGKGPLSYTLRRLFEFSDPKYSCAPGVGEKVGEEIEGEAGKNGILITGSEKQIIDNYSTSSISLETSSNASIPSSYHTFQSLEVKTDQTASPSASPSATPAAVKIIGRRAKRALARMAKDERARQKEALENLPASWEARGLSLTSPPPPPIAVRVYNPSPLLAALRGINPGKFKPDQPHDSHEALLALLNGLKNEQIQEVLLTKTLSPQRSFSLPPPSLSPFQSPTPSKLTDDTLTSRLFQGGLVHEIIRDLSTSTPPLSPPPYISNGCPDNPWSERRDGESEEGKKMKKWEETFLGLSLPPSFMERKEG